MKLKFLVLLSIILTACSGGKDAGSQNEIKDYDDLVGYKVAVINGAMQDIELSKRGDLNLLRLASPAELLAAVESGRADYCVEDSTSCIGSHIEQRGLRVEFSNNLGEGGRVALGFRKEHTELCRQFNEFLAENLRKTGAEVGVYDDGLVIRGLETIVNGSGFDGGKWPEIGLALSVLSVALGNDEPVANADLVEATYPGVLEKLKKVLIAEKTEKSEPTT